MAEAWAKRPYNVNYHYSILQHYLSVGEKNHRLFAIATTPMIILCFYPEGKDKAPVQNKIHCCELGKPEPVVVVPVVGRVVVAIRHTAVCRVVVPTATAEHTV